MACATGARSAQGAELAHLLTGRSLVFLFSAWWPSQIETFDPKMTAPGGICSVNGEIATKLPGVTFGSSFPKLASLADRFSVVRSFQTGDGNHDNQASRRQGHQRGQSGVAVRPGGGAEPTWQRSANKCDAVSAGGCAGSEPGITSFGDFQSAGFLGSGFAPFTPSSGGAMQDKLEAQVANRSTG